MPLQELNAEEERKRREEEEKKLSQQQSRKNNKKRKGTYGKKRATAGIIRRQGRVLTMMSLRLILIASRSVMLRVIKSGAVHE